MKKQSSKERLKLALTTEFGRNVKEHYENEKDYVILQRSVLESMDNDFQTKFIALMEEVESTFDFSDAPKDYAVFAISDEKNSQGGVKYVADKYIDKTPPRYRK